MTRLAGGPPASAVALAVAANSVWPDAPSLPVGYDMSVDPDDPDTRITFELGGLSVCPDHLEDPYLHHWVAENADATTCDFCDREESTPIAAPADEVARLVLQGLQRAWGDYNDEMVPWGLGFDSPQTTLELVYDEGVTEDDAFAARLHRALPDLAWVQRDFFRLTPLQRLTSAWDAFVYEVKHRSRFFFGFAAADPDDPDDVAPIDLLGEIAQAADVASLIERWPAGTTVYRSRPHDKPGDAYTDAWDLAALPMDKASKAAANRMSPAGVPLFYGALDPDGAIAEALSATTPPPPGATTGTFQTLRDLDILDLSHGVDVPSLFDELRGDQLPALAFLAQFVRHVAADVKRDGKEHIEYVPTQVVCEFFRSVTPAGRTRPLDGIAYPSSQHPGSTCIVLFIDNDETENHDGGRPPRPKSEAWLGPLNHGPAPRLRLIDAAPTTTTAPLAGRSAGPALDADIPFDPGGSVIDGL